MYLRLCTQDYVLKTMHHVTPQEHRMKIATAIIFLSIAWASFSWMPEAGPTSSIRNKTKAGDFIVEPPTLLCAGFEWIIDGDENRNAGVSVEYRKKGGEQWQSALPLLRIGGEKVFGHEQRWVYTTPHMFAGSLFNLEPGTPYECRFQLSDPDGVEGLAGRVIVIQTKREPRPYDLGQVYHVYPPGYKGPKES